MLTYSVYNRPLNQLTVTVDRIQRTNETKRLGRTLSKDVANVLPQEAKLNIIKPISTNKLGMDKVFTSELQLVDKDSTTQRGKYILDLTI